MPHAMSDVVSRLKVGDGFYPVIDAIHDCIFITNGSSAGMITRRQIDDNDGNVQHIANGLIKGYLKYASEKDEREQAARESTQGS